MMVITEVFGCRKWSAVSGTATSGTATPGAAASSTAASSTSASSTAASATSASAAAHHLTRAADYSARPEGQATCQ